VSKAEAVPRTRYHFVLNDDVEVMDPAARAMLDRGTFSASFGDNPADLDSSFMVAGVGFGKRVCGGTCATVATLGWASLLIYDIHAKRFTDIKTSAEPAEPRAGFFRWRFLPPFLSR